MACDRGRICGDDISLHRGCTGMVAREEWLRYQHDASPMFDIPGSTLVWTLYILFFYFQDIKTYVYVYVLKSIRIIKEH